MTNLLLSLQSVLTIRKLSVFLVLEGFSCHKITREAWAKKIGGMTHFTKAEIGYPIKFYKSVNERVVIYLCSHLQYNLLIQKTFFTFV